MLPMLMPLSTTSPECQGNADLQSPKPGALALMRPGGDPRRGVGGFKNGGWMISTEQKEPYLRKWTRATLVVVRSVLEFCEIQVELWYRKPFLPSL